MRLAGKVILGNRVAMQALDGESSLLQAANEAAFSLDSPGGVVGAVIGGLALLLGIAALAGYLAFQNATKRQDGVKDEDLPPWANGVEILTDVLAGKPFDQVLLNMRARHGDAFRIFIPSLFGETIVLMGREANQFVFNENDRNLEQALGNLIGTAVSGEKTMGTKARKNDDAGKIFDKASANFFANKAALNRATTIFLDSAEVFCDKMEKEIQPEQNVFELLWKYVVQTNADMLYGEGENAGSIVCRTIDTINKEGLLSPRVRDSGADLRVVLQRSYQDRVANPQKYAGEDSLFEEFFRLSEGKADEDMLASAQQLMLTLQLAANGNQLVTIRWLMSHVYEDKELLRAIRQEVAAKLKQKGEGATLRSLNLDDLLDLKLIQACITEAVRLHSDIPSKLTFRQADVDLEFGKYKIPKGSVLFLYANAVHKDEKFFPNANGFCPHRYTNAEEYNRMQKDKELVVFGHGRKRCTGELHARSQISALLAAFAMRFDSDLVTSVQNNRMPEDWDGPFIFDTANTLKLVNLRPRVLAEAEALREPMVAAAALYGLRAESDAPSASGCPFHQKGDAA